jgi:hypothetical protein
MENYPIFIKQASFTKSEPEPGLTQFTTLLMLLLTVAIKRTRQELPVALHAHFLLGFHWFYCNRSYEYVSSIL